MEKNKITTEKYWEMMGSIDSLECEEELIDTHQKLIGKTRDDGIYVIKDCGVKFIERFLTRDWGRSIVYNYNQGAQKFIYSSYLSDYFKKIIIESIEDEATINILNSDKIINDMSEEEIKMIYFSLIKVCSDEKDILNSFIQFLYKLNGNGVISFIKNNINKSELAKQILLTSGLLDDASYYSGRGVNLEDLNVEKLESIFNKLLRIDVCSAINYVEMVCRMKTLGATEFIISFKKLVNNDFQISDLEIEESNASLDGVSEQSRDIIVFCTILSASRRLAERDIDATAQMKDSFVSSIKPLLLKIYPDYGKLLEQYSNYKVSLKPNEEKNHSK